MARGIDHREAETLVDAYKLGGLPNWAMYSGKEIVVGYDGGDMEAGETMLTDYLDLLSQRPGKTVYTLRMYDANTKKITNKTAYSGSTTFMLDPDADIVSDPKTGLMVINRPGGSVSGPRVDPAAAAELQQLKEDNRKLLDRLHSEELKRIADGFTAQIAGLKTEMMANQQPELSWWDKIEKVIDKIIEKPEALQKIAGIFKGEKKDYVQEYQVKKQPDLAGTKATQDMPQEPHEPHEQIEVHTLQQLQAMTEEELQDLQSDALEHLAGRIGEAKVTEMILAVYRMDDKQLNKLLSYLD